MPNMKKGVSPTTIPIIYISWITIFIFCKHIANFIKTFFQNQSECKTNNLNNANEALARSLWIRTHSRHLECELLLDERLVHLPGCSQVFGAVAGDCVYKALLDLFKVCQKKKFQKYKKIKKIKKNLVDDCGFWSAKVLAKDKSWYLSDPLWSTSLTWEFS